MKLETWLIGMAGALALGFVGSSAQAAPAGGLSELKAAAGQNSEVQDVHYGRRRHWRGYYYDRPHRYRYRRHYGYGPGFYFHFGPRRHYRHYRHYW